MKKVIVWLLLISLVTILLITGCTSQSAEKNEIVLGTSTSLTGELAREGTAGNWGLQAAIDDINAQGGIYVKDLDKKLKVKLIVRDNETDMIKAASLAEDLVLSQKVDFLATGNCSPVLAAPIANIAEKHKIPFVVNCGPFEPFQAMRATASPSWQYSWSMHFAIGTPAPAGDYRYQVPGYNTMDVATVVVQDLVSQTNKKAALFAVDDADGRSWYEAFPPALASMGITTVGFDKELGMAPADTTDFTSIINEWKANNCEILVGNTPAGYFVTLYRQCVSLGFKPKMVWAEHAAISYADIVNLGGDLPNGICVTGPWSPAFDPQVCPGIGGSTPASVNERYIADTGDPWHPSLGQGYTVGQVLFDAIERAGSLDKEKVNTALATTDLSTLDGRVKWISDTHASIQPLVFLQWQKVDKPYKWEAEVIVSLFDWLPATAKPLFPIPW